MHLHFLDLHFDTHAIKTLSRENESLVNDIDNIDQEIIDIQRRLFAAQLKRKELINKLKSSQRGNSI